MNPDPLFLPPDAIAPGDLRRVLVVKLRNLGDVLLASPVISVLKRQAPHLEIDALVYADTADMLRGHPDLGELHEIHRDIWASLRVEVQDRPAQVNLWQAANPKARDFRVDVIGHAYSSSVLAETSPGIYEARVPKPAQGYKAFFVELVYPGGGKYPFKFTTEVSVVPDVLPFKWESAVSR